MAYSYSFFDEQTAGAEQLNKWVSLFVTDGIADEFKDGVPYSLSKLNSLVRNNCSAGIVPETNTALKVSISGNMVQIAPGIAFFEDGSVLEVTDTEQLAFEPDIRQYVYLKSDVSQNKAYPKVDVQLDTDNTVLLAEISEQGAVTDRRVYAKGKVPSFYASDVFLPGYTEFVIDKPGDYLLCRGAHSYTKAFFTGYQEPFAVNHDHPPMLVLYHAELANHNVQGIAFELNTLATNSSMFGEQSAGWANGVGQKMVLLDKYYGGKTYKIYGEFTQKNGNLYLTVTFGGTASESQYISNKQGLPLYCKMFLV